MVADAIQTAVLLVIGFFAWKFLQTQNQAKKEKQKDEAQLKKISQRYSGDDISNPVNNLIERLRNK